jgi:hypothetical protein
VVLIIAFTSNGGSGTNNGGSGATHSTSRLPTVLVGNNGNGNNGSGDNSGDQGGLPTDFPGATTP